MREKSPNGFGKKRIIIGCIGILSLFIILSVFSNIFSLTGVTSADKSTEAADEHHYARSIILSTITDKASAQRAGIKGYVKISTAADFNKEVTYTKGQQILIPIEITYLCFDPTAPTASITIDPKGENGLVIEKVVDKDNTIRFNDFTNYNIEGKYVLKANETIKLTMTMNIPDDMISTKVHINALGVSADTYLLNDVRVNLIG